MSKTALCRIKFVNTPISTKKNANFWADGIAPRMRLMEAWYICKRRGGCAGLIAGSTGLALAAQRRHEEEEQRHAEQVHRQNERQRLVERMKLLLAFEQKQADVSSWQIDAKIERMEAEEERRYQQQARTPAIPAFDMAQWKQQDYAESLRWEKRQAYARFRQQKSAGYVVSSTQEKPWWRQPIGYRTILVGVIGGVVGGLLGGLPGLISGAAVGATIGAIWGSSEEGYIQTTGLSCMDMGNFLHINERIG
jgi:hypothetical protein